MTTICIYIDINKTCCYCSGGTYIRVSELTDFTCAGKKNGFKCFSHYIWKNGSNDLKFLIQSANEKDCYKEIKLCKNSNRECTSEETIKLDDKHRNVYVYFYDKDPRPLLVCYNGKAYIPQSKDEYDCKWVNVENVKKCLCK